MLLGALLGVQGKARCAGEARPKEETGGPRGQQTIAVLGQLEPMATY